MYSFGTCKCYDAEKCCGPNNLKSGDVFKHWVNLQLSSYFYNAPVTPAMFLNSIVETETPALEGNQGDQSESEHVSCGVRQQMILECCVHGHV